MVLCYIDESGDDGYPLYSSPLFVLTVCYFDEKYFKSNFELIKSFRKTLKEKYGLYTGIELHLRELIQNKKPYTGIGLTKEIRKSIVNDIFEFIGSDDLKVRFINVCVDKTSIAQDNFSVLENTLKYLIRRIENDLKENGNLNFLCISDDGRVKIMNRIARKIRKFDMLPSKGKESAENKPIELMIEDIFEKPSTESHFIQLSDCVSRIINLYTLQNHSAPKIEWTRKTRKFLKYGDEIKFLEQIKSKLNLKAATGKPFGIKYIT